MAGILAIICFFISYLEQGGAITTGDHWLDSAALMILGLLFLAFHVVYPIAVGRFTR